MAAARTKIFMIYKNAQSESIYEFMLSGYQECGHFIVQVYAKVDFDCIEVRYIATIRRRVNLCYIEKNIAEHSII